MYVTKVMSSSCDLCIRYLLEYTHNPKLIPILANGMSSKSTSTRRCVMCVVYSVLLLPPIPHCYKVIVLNIATL